MSNNTVPTKDGGEFSYSLLDVVGTLYRWRKLIAMLVGAVTAGAVMITLMLSNYYKAFATLMPANEEKELFAETAGANNGLYGDDDAIDRLMIFAESPMLIGGMIRIFDLPTRYGIDASTPKGQDKVAQRFLKLYKVKKNPYSGIEVSIEDTDPLFAAKMMDTLLVELQRVYAAATFSNKQQLLATYEAALVDKKKEIKSLTDSIAMLRTRYSIYDVKKQSELLGSLVVEAEANLSESRSKLKIYSQGGGKQDSIVNLRARIEGLEQTLVMLRADNSDSATAINLARFNEGRDLVLDYEKQIEAASENLGDMQKQFAQFRAQANSLASSIIVLDPVQIPKIKSYPSRSILVIGAAFLALVLGSIAAIVLDMYARIDWAVVLGKKSEEKAAETSPASASTSEENPKA